LLVDELDSSDDEFEFGVYAATIQRQNRRNRERRLARQRPFETAMNKQRPVPLVRHNAMAYA